MKKEIDIIEYLEIEKSLEITLGTIVKVERIPKSKKMLSLSVFFGGEEKSVVTNIGDKIDPELLVGRQFPFVTNLKPVSIMGIESLAMIMVPTNTDGTPDFSPTPLAGLKLI